MRDDEPRPVWMSLLITHCVCVFTSELAYPLRAGQPCAPVPSTCDRRKGPTVAFSVKNSNLCTLVQRISTMVLIYLYSTIRGVKI